MILGYYCTSYRKLDVMSRVVHSFELSEPFKTGANVTLGHVKLNVHILGHVKLNVK